MSKQNRVRATTHRGRSGRAGVYSTKHNDRNFDVGNSSHIDPAKSFQNTYWHRYQKTHPEYKTFDEVEKAFYEKNFSAALEAKNARAIKSRHKERVQTIDDFRHTERYAPEEIILQLGNRNQEYRPTSQILWTVISEFSKWQKSLWKDKKDFVKIEPLDVALHRDEPQAADHAHWRQVYMVKENGVWIPSQEKALKALEIELPDPQKKEGRYNNRKVTFTAMCREKFIEIAQKHGVEIETIPKDPSENGLSLMEFKAQKLSEKIAALEKNLNRLQSMEAAINRDTFLRNEYPEIWEKADKFVKNYEKIQPFKPKKEHTVIKEKNQQFSTDFNSR